MSLASQGCTQLAGPPIPVPAEPTNILWEDIYLWCPSTQWECFRGIARVPGRRRLPKEVASSTDLKNKNETLESLHNVCAREKTPIKRQSFRAWCHKSDSIKGSRRWMLAPGSWKESKRKYIVNLSTVCLNCKRWLGHQADFFPRKKF